MSFARFAREAARVAKRVVLDHPGLLIFAIALVPRLVFLAQLRANSPTFWMPEGADSILYDRLASGVPEPARAYFHSPLYIGFLTAAYKVFGRNLLAVRLVQHALGALACVLVHHVTWRVFHARTTAFLAGALAAIAGPVIFYEGQLGIDALMPFLVMTCAALAVRASQRRRAIDWLFLGVAVGVTALGRAVVLAWMPLFAVWAYASTSRSQSRLARAGGIAGLVLGAALVIAPVTIRNARVEKGFVLITANGGLNLYVGNNPRANGAYSYPRGLDFRPGDTTDDYEGKRAAEESEGVAMTSADVSSWWSQKAWAFMRANPERTGALVVEKAKLLLTNAEYMQLHDYDVYREVAPILRALPMAGLLVVPGIAGLIALTLSKRRPLAHRLAWMTVTFALSFLPFFVVGRYRAPWLLLLAPFASFAVVRLARALKERAWREAAIVAVAAAATLLAITRPIAPAPGTGFQYMAFARASLTSGHREAAAHWCERATLRDPNAMDAVALLARLRREDHRFDDAEQVLTLALNRYPRDSGLWLELGRVRLETGRAQSAVDALRASIDGDPRSIAAWSSLAAALHASGREADAASASRSLSVLREAGGG